MLTHMITETGPKLGGQGLENVYKHSSFSWLKCLKETLENSKSSRIEMLNYYAIKESVATLSK